MRHTIALIAARNMERLMKDDRFIACLRENAPGLAADMLNCLELDRMNSRYCCCCYSVKLSKATRCFTQCEKCYERCRNSTCHSNDN